MVLARGLAVAAALSCFGGVGASAADLGTSHRHRHQQYRARLVAPPVGYAYGGYGNGPGPGWVDGDGRLGYAPGIVPGYGYIPAGAPPTIFDLGY